MRGGMIIVTWISFAAIVAAAAPRETFPLGGQEGISYVVDFTPNGKLLASGGKDGTIVLWDVAGRNEVRRLTGHEGPVYALAFAKEGACLVSVGHDKTLRVWDVKEGKSKIEPVKGLPDVVMSLAINGDVSRIATGCYNGEVQLWDNKGESKGKAQSHTGPVYALAFSPDNATLVSGGRDGLVKIWNVADAKTDGEIKIGKQTIWDIACVPETKTIAVASGNNVTLWDVGSKLQKGEFVGHLAAVRSLAIAGKTPMLATASEDGTARVWDIATKAEKAIARPNAGTLTGVALTPDLRTLAVASADESKSVRLWELKIE